MKNSFFNNLRNILLLLLTFLIYSGTSIFSKCASYHQVFSIPYISFFSCTILLLFLYAILWQKVLSIFPLNRAFLYKSSTIIMILCISHFVFDELITINNILGVVLIIIGLVFLSWEM